MEPQKKPRTFLVVLFPCFQLLDLTGPLDVFNNLSLRLADPTEIEMKFVAETSDPVPTKPITPPRGADWTYNVEPFGKDSIDQVNTRFCQWFTPDLTFTETLTQLKEGRWEADMVLVPGGVGSRLTRTFSSGDDGGSARRQDELVAKPTVDFLVDVQEHLRYGYMTVCTGSLVLGYTGLLDGRRATTNMSRFEYVASRLPNVKWAKGARWVKSERAEGNGRQEIWTSAGVSAGIDLALEFVAEYWGGIETSREIAKMMEYDWTEPGEGEICKFYHSYFGV